MYPVWIYILAGLWGGKRLVTETVLLNYEQIILIFFSTTMVMGSAYILNQIKDLETDRINNKFFLLTKDIISVKAAWIEAMILFLLGLVLGFFLNSGIGSALIVLFLLAGFCYNFAPLKLKNKPFGGMLINGIGGYIIYSLGWSVVYDRFILPVQGIPYFFAVLALYLNTTIPDYKGDKQTDKVTFSVKFGIKTTQIFALVCEIITLLTALYFKDWILGIPAFLILPFFIRSCLKIDTSVSLQATKFAIAVLTVMICIVYIWYAVLVVFIFGMTKLYYHKRLNFNYPALKV